MRRRRPRGVPTEVQRQADILMRHLSRAGATSYFATIPYMQRGLLIDETVVRAACLLAAKSDFKRGVRTL